MGLDTTSTAPFEPLVINGDSETLKTTGKTVVVPTGNPEILPACNEYAGNTNRVSIAESPFGGLKGSGFPDYCPGTVHIISGGGAYLTDVNGENTTKTLTAGKLIELGYLSVNTDIHTISEEFIVENTNTDNGSVDLNLCGSTDGWSILHGTGEISVESGKIKVVGTSDSSGLLLICRELSVNAASYNYLGFKINTSLAGTMYIDLACTGDVYQGWSGDRFSCAANTDTSFVLPLIAPAGTKGQNPVYTTGTFDKLNITYTCVGVQVTANSEVTLYIDDIRLDKGLTTFIEIQIPDQLADTSAQIYTHNGTGYQLSRTCKLDPSYELVSDVSECFTAYDGTQYDAMYGTSLGRSEYPKGIAGDVKTGSLSGSQITYSMNPGAKYRVGISANLPPTDNNRTNNNKIRYKIVWYYSGPLSNMGSTSYAFENSDNASYGLQNQIKPWIAVLDSENHNIDFYLFTYKPKNFVYKRDETGNIYELDVFPGNGVIYHGNMFYEQQELDSNSDNIPDCISPDTDGSLQQLLQSYDFAMEWCTEYDLSESAIVTNDFWITTDDLDLMPFAVSEGDTVFTIGHAFLPVVDTVSTATGNVSIVNVKGQTVVGVRNTPYTNAGDCKVWDTVTPENITESTWERVYDTDHLFTGDCVLDNSIIRLITHVNDEFYRIGLLYLYINNNWVFIKEIRARTYPTVYTLNSISATIISPEKVEILGQTPAYSRYLAISKGSFSLEIHGGLGSEILFEGEPEISDSRFLYWGNLRDVYADVHGGEDWYQSDNHYLALINPESSFIWYVSSSICPEYYGLTTPELADAVHIIPNTEELKGYIGAIPCDCSKLFYEAESMTLIGTGERPYSEDFIGISLTLVNDGVQCSNILDPGTYTVYARVKSSLNESNGGRFHIKYYTPDMVNISDNSVSTSGTIEYLSDTFTVPQEAVGPIFISFIKYTNSANQLDVDYLLIVPTKLIEKHVESVLYQLSPMTKQLKYSYDVKEIVPPEIPSVPTVNLLDNASFESGETVSHGWSYENYAKGTPIYSKSTTTGVVDGSLAQQISYTGVEEDGEYSAVVCYQAPVYVTGGYKVDFYIYICGTLKNGKLIYGIESKDINSESISYVERTFKSLPSNPTQILVSYVCPENAYFLVAYLKFEDLVSPSSSFTAYIDNAKLLSEDGCIPWCGINWRAQMGTDQAPADNNWSRSPNNVWVDEDNKLHMTIRKDDGAWNCTELRSSPILFGKFTWTIESPIFNLDKNAIFGLFLYTDDTHEIDIEISRWTADQNDLILYSVQPSEVEGNSTGYVPSITVDGITTAESGYSGSNLTCQIDWKPDYIDWKAWDNNGNIIAEKHYTDITQIPQVALELRMNLWLKHAIPIDGNDIEIVISLVDIILYDFKAYTYDPFKEPLDVDNFQKNRSIEYYQTIKSCEICQPIKTVDIYQ